VTKPVFPSFLGCYSDLALLPCTDAYQTLERVISSAFGHGLNSWRPGSIDSQYYNGSLRGSVKKSHGRFQ